MLAAAGVTVVAAPAHAAITGVVDSGVLTVSSDGASDTMVFTCTASGFLVNGVQPTGSNVPCNGTTSLTVLGNGGDDVIDISGLNGTSTDGITVDAGDGNDHVTGGGFITGNTNLVTITGGPGNDTMIGNRSEIVRGGPGDDVLSDFGVSDQLLDGEAGTDTYVYDLSFAGNIGIDLTPLNGGLVVQVAGGAGQFFSWASIEAVNLVMNAGNNTVNSFAFDGTSKVLAGGGNDTLIGGDSADQLDGGPGDDTVEGGAGADSVAAGDGADLLRMADGVADGVDCGTGGDIVVADPSDALAGCETVNIPPQPAVPDTTKPVPSVGAGKLKGKQVRVPVRCPAAEVRCVGDVVLKVVGKRNGKTTKVAIGRALVVADGGDREMVKVTVSAAKAKAIRALTKPKLKVAYDLVDVAGNTAKGTATVKLRVP